MVRRRRVKDKYGNIPLRVYLVPALRRIWYWSKARKDCKKNAKECNKCHKIFDKYHADHIEAIGEAPDEYVGWDSYIQKMFLGKLQALCSECHRKKTNKENEERRKKDNK